MSEREQLKQLNFRMSPDLYERLRANAKDDERSINRQVCYIVRQYLDGSRYGTLDSAEATSQVPPGGYP